MEKKKAMVIINPSSGKEEAKNQEETIQEVLAKRYKTKVYHTEKAGDAQDFSLEAAREKYHLVVAVGGDGTVNEVVSGLAEKDHRPLLGIVPMGTVNDLTRALGISQDPIEAMAVLRGEAYKAIDVGKVNDRYFMNALALGSIPESIHEVTPEEKSKLGPLAYFLAGMKRLLEEKKMHLIIETEKDVYEGAYCVMVGSLTGSIGGFEEIFPKASIDDGLLHVLLVKELNLLESLKLLPDFVAGDVSSSEHLVYVTVKKMRIRSQREEPYVSDMDGEEGPKVPLVVEILPRHLRVLVPNGEG